MTKTETITVSLIVGIICPALLFVLLWWSSAALAIYVPIPERLIIMTALSGLAAGIVLDIIYLKKWSLQFYHLKMWFLVLVYLFCSAIATAICMGLPLGNLVLGTLAGAYIGRRAFHSTQSRRMFSQTAKKVAVFTAVITGAWTLLIGICALSEEVVIDFFQSVMGLTPAIISGPVGIGLVILCGFILMIGQYWCSKALAWKMFRFEWTKGARAFS